jgi:hypothetical protein
MDDPVATCFRIAEIEHDGIVARGSNKAAIRSWRNIPISLVDRGSGPSPVRYRLIASIIVEISEDSA